MFLHETDFNGVEWRKQENPWVQYCNVHHSYTFLGFKCDQSATFEVVQCTILATFTRRNITKVLIWKHHFYPTKSLEPRCFRWFCPLDPHQGFALDRLGDSTRPPDPLPKTCVPSNFKPWIHPWKLNCWFCYTHAYNIPICYICKIFNDIKGSHPWHHVL